MEGRAPLGRMSGYRQWGIHRPRSIEAPVWASVVPKDVRAKMATLDKTIEGLSRMRPRATWA
eukprot:6337474-Pyramimonas_sp.AAC.1